MRSFNNQLSYAQYWFDFVVAMTLKEVKARYKLAIFGFLWILINPILQMVVIGSIFQFFMPIASEYNYFLYLFCGLLLWIFFSLSLSKATPGIVNEKSLMEKTVFPREAIIIAIVLSNYIHMMISYVLLFVGLLIFSIFSFGQTILFPQTLFYLLLFLAATFWLSLVVTGIGMLTSALNVRFRDINFFVQAVLPLWFYATPVIYSMDVLPKKLVPFFYFNPLILPLDLVRKMLFDQPLADTTLYGVSLLAGFNIVYVGVIVFKNMESTFDDYM